MTLKYIFWVVLVSSGQFHWTRCDTDTCQILDTCLYFNVSSETGHWTQTDLFFFLYANKSFVTTFM